MGLWNFFQGASEESEQNSAKAAAAPVAPRKYTVKAGDTLSGIAKQFYGRATDWHKIHEANADQIRNPNIIKEGRELLIP